MALFKDTSSTIREDSQLLSRIRRRLLRVIDDNDYDWDGIIEKENGSKMTSWRVAWLFIQRWIQWQDLLESSRLLYGTKKTNLFNYAEKEKSFYIIARKLVKNKNLLRKIYDNTNAEVVGDILADASCSNFDGLMDQMIIWDLKAMACRWLGDNCSNDSFDFNVTYNILDRRINDLFNFAFEKESSKTVAELCFYRTSCLKSLHNKNQKNQSIVLNKLSQINLNKDGSYHINKTPEKIETMPFMENTLNPILQSLDEIISDGGYPHFYENLTDGFIPSAIDRDDINIIPGVLDSKCCPILLAFNKGSSGGRGVNARGFRKTLDKIIEHLIQCGPGRPASGVHTQHVVLITDHWDSDDFEEFYNKFSAFAAQGIYFTFRLCSSGGANSRISELNVKL